MNSITASQYQIYLYHNLSVIVDRSCPQYCDEHDIVVHIAKLWDEAEKLWAEANKLTAEAKKLTAAAAKLKAEAENLIAEARKLWAERGKLWAEAESRKLKEKPCQCFSIPEEVQRRFDTAARLRSL